MDDTSSAAYAAGVGAKRKATEDLLDAAVEPATTVIIDPVVAAGGMEPAAEEVVVVEQNTAATLVLETDEHQSSAEQEIIPNVVFLVPYRDRVQQRAFFQRHMTGTVLADMPTGSHQIWIVHQCDARRFNRGAVKNIGLRIAQDVYPDHWRDITFVFNDIDTMPFTAGFFDYPTHHGVVKHFFGFTFALGGIVSITGHDFDRVGGFPNLWAWGFVSISRPSFFSSSFILHRHKQPPLFPLFAQVRGQHAAGAVRGARGGRRPLGLLQRDG